MKSFTFIGRYYLLPMILILINFNFSAAQNVGIGTNSPENKLHVVGDARIDDTSPHLYYYVGNNILGSVGIFSGQMNIINKSTTGGMVLATNSFERMRIDVNGNIGIGTNVPISKLSVNGNGSSDVSIYGENNIENGVGIAGNSVTNLGSGVGGYTSGAKGYGVFGYATSTDSVENFGGYFRTDGSIGTAVYGIASSTASLNYGGRFLAEGPSGIGVFGTANNTSNTVNYGGYFISKSTFGYGALGLGTGAYGTGIRGTATGNYGKGVVGYSSGAAGIALEGTAIGEQGKGVVGDASGTFGIAIEGHASGTYAKGLYCDVSGANGIGVYGEASHEGFANNFGGYFQTAGDVGTAVFGYATSGESSNFGGRFYANGPLGVGVLGSASNINGDMNYGGQFYASGSNGHGVASEAYGEHGTGVKGTANGADGIGLIGIASGTGGVGVEGNGNSYNFRAVGSGIDYGSNSSIRWKNNIVEIDQPLQKLFALRGVYFEWDDDHGGGDDVGMIAEEVGQVLPEIVLYEANGIDAQGMDYSRLTPLLVEVAKAQQKIIEKLEEQIEALILKVEVLSNQSFK